VLDQHRLLVPARGGDRPTTPADLLDPLVRSDRWRRRRPHIDNLAPLTPALLGPSSEASQRWQRCGWISNVSSTSSMRLLEDDDAPGCLPGLRPDLLRDERFFAGFFDHGASEDGGREEFDESQANRRSSSVTRCVNAATMRRSSSCSARNTAFSVRNPAFSARSTAFSAASCPSSARSGPTTPSPDPSRRSTQHAGDHVTPAPPATTTPGMNSYSDINSANPRVNISALNKLTEACR
jgi:hypothetical protein